MNFHELDIEQAFSETGSSLKGLTAEEAAARLQKFGSNELVDKRKKSAWTILFSQFKDFMIVILVAAAVVSGIVGDLTDTVIIIIIVLLNAIIGFIQEYRSEKAMEALTKMAATHSNVLRNEKPETVNTSNLVPGDVVLLEAGTLVPADLRLLETHALRIEESSLTGESVPVDKNTDPVSAGTTALGDRVNMAYKGTQVINGRGSGLIVATGIKTELGHIAEMLQQGETETPLQKRMTHFGKRLSIFIGIICLAVFGIGLLRGEKPIEMLLIAISLAVAAIPEALPTLIVVALARGAKRMVQVNALIRKLPAVETLGSVTYICTDKTGTLTQNKMEVVEIKPFENALKPLEHISMLELSMALNHDVKHTNKERIGDPTEIAMLNYLEQKKEGINVVEASNKFKRVAELPFDSERKLMTTIHDYEGKYLVIVKGAAESITGILAAGELKENIQKETTDLAAKGMRVLAFGYRVHEKTLDIKKADEVEQAVEYAGLIGMIDPPREGIKDAIDECKTAGIHPVMITGDHRDTAIAIAKEIGILSENDMVLTGDELSKLPADGLKEKVESTRVYARVSPRQKLDIVEALQAKEHFVAMTGDGVNDAPSLKKANIGVAMGITGTDVSKEAAHMILLDDNFATIVRAVREGRRIYDNIRKFVKYIMTCNSAEILLIFLAPIFGLPNPLLPIHILWINFVTDGLPGLALSAEKEEVNIMRRPPRKTNESLFAGGTGYHIIWVGVLMAGVSIATQAVAINHETAHWQTMVFTVISFAQLAHVYAIRSDHDYIFKIGLFSNKPLIIALVVTFILQLGVIYLPFANNIFKTEPLSFKELMICIGVSAIVFHCVELEKFIRKLRKQ